MNSSHVSDASKAYTYLCENVPKWLESIEDIRQRMSEKQDAVSKIAVPATPMVKRSGSNETIRGERNNLTHANGIAIEVTSAAQANSEADTRASSPQHPAQGLLTKRKRKTASVLSGHMSGPSKYRSRNLIVVYYDSEVQKSFEAMVRNIGAGRNLLRKGKMAARIESLGNLGQESDEDDGEYDDPIMAKIGYRPKLGITPYRTARARGGFQTSKDSGTDQFDSTDKALERAQGLCERGAHQFLRDGDCGTELDNCKELLLEVGTLAEPEAAKYRVKDEENRVRQLAREEKEKEKEKQEKAILRDSPHIPDSHGLLEVDDDVDDNEETTLESLEALRPFRMRSRMATRV